MIVLVAMASLVLSIGPGGCDHLRPARWQPPPQRGALLADFDPDSPGPDILCSDTLIAPRVFLTAAHCTADLAAEGITEV
jgi:hypothetical protein